MIVLLIKRGAIGDILMVTPLIRQLKQVCTVDILIGESASVAIESNQYISNLYKIKDKCFTLKRIYHLVIKLIALRKNKYDFVFVLDKHWIFNLLSKIISKNNIGFYRNSWEWLFVRNGIHYFDINKYQAEYYLDLLKFIVPKYNRHDIKIDIFLDKRIHKNTQANIDNYIAITNSGGKNVYESSSCRKLPPDIIIELMRYFLFHNINVVLIGGKDDIFEYNNYIEALTEYKRDVFNLAGLLSVYESMLYIKNAKWFFTTDCGAMHIGIAAQQLKNTANITMIFGATNPAHVVPSNYLQYTIWHDSNLYNKNYQLKGVVNKNKKFFSTIATKDIIAHFNELCTTVV